MRAVQHPFSGLPAARIFREALPGALRRRFLRFSRRYDSAGKQNRGYGRRSGHRRRDAFSVCVAPVLVQENVAIVRLLVPERSTARVGIEPAFDQTGGCVPRGECLQWASSLPERSPRKYPGRNLFHSGQGPGDRSRRGGGGRDADRNKETLRGRDGSERNGEINRIGGRFRRSP